MGETGQGRTLNETLQSQKHRHCGIPLTEGPRGVKPRRLLYETGEGRLPGGEGEGLGS